MRNTLVVVVAVGMLLGCSHGDGDDDAGFDPNTPPPPLTDSRQFRAIAGVSMGGYGALNVGSKHPELFGVIASLGGPVDMVRLLHDARFDNFEVKSQTEIPRAVGDDFTFDHLPPYPDRDTRVTMFQDLVIAFGNPFLHHPDSARQYLASDSEAAALGQDDDFGTFTPVSFSDGGDGNQDGLRQVGEAPALETEVMLAAGGSAASLAGTVTTDVGGRALADVNGDGVYDVGDGLILNFSEPFVDSDDDFVFEPELGETYSDDGLDGVPGSADFGEGNGRFDYDPDRERWLAEDPLTRLAGRSAAEIEMQRIYMDVGLADEFGFARHYENLAAVLEDKGLGVDVVNGLDFNCANLPRLESPYTLTFYDAGHVGVESVDRDDLFEGNVCGEETVWQRILAMVGFLNDSFPDGFFGPGGDFDLPDIDFDDLDVDFPDLDPTGDNIDREIVSPALGTGSGPDPSRQVVVYRPPAFFHSDERFPVVYFLVGYGHEAADFRRVGDLLDLLILSGQLQNMFFVFVPGAGGRAGSFYVNHEVPESQVPGITPTSGRYEDSLLEDLIPFIEDQLLERRVRR